jgi:hypothetical protein
MLKYNYLFITTFTIKTFYVKELLPSSQKIRIPRYYKNDDAQGRNTTKVISINELISNKAKYIYCDHVSHFRLHNATSNKPPLGHYKDVFYLI